MKEGWVADIVRETTVINLNAIRRIDFCDLLRSEGHFLWTLRIWLRKHGIPFWADGKYFVETKRPKEVYCGQESYEASRNS